MSEHELTSTEVRLNAPTYMRPRRPVLEEPLDLGRGKQEVVQPTAREAVVIEVSEDFVTSPIRLTAASLTEVESTPEAAAEVETPVAAPEIPLAEDITPLETAEPISETRGEIEPAAEPAPEATEEAQPRRKGMSIFQQVIVFLLLLMVTLGLATIYLYIQGWVELPPAVLEIVEKGLSLIP